jgi:hypothetical protein
MKNKIQPGDIYSLKIDENFYIFLRVLLSINMQCIEKKLIDKTSRLFVFKDCELIEIYKEYSSTPETDIESLKETIAPTIYCSFAGLLSNEDWSLISSKKVDLTEVNPPEFVVSNGPFKASFEKGEVSVPFDFAMDKVRSLDVLPKTYPGNSLKMFYAANAGVKHDFKFIPDQLKWCKAERYSLEISEEKKEIYRQVSLTQPINYLQLSKQFGKDLSRFYD